MFMFRCCRRSLVALPIGLLIIASANAADFVYQGQLVDHNQPADGQFDVQLTPYVDTKLGASSVGTITFPSVQVRHGQFQLEFALALSAGEQAWVEIAVRDAGIGSFSAIPGRTKAISAALVGQCWSSTGDSGTNPSTNFLGTTDNQPFVVRTNNIQSLRIQPSAIVSGPLNLPITSNTISGAGGNFASTNVRGATIAGGGVTGNVDPEYAAGASNQVASHYGTVGGGFSNVAGDPAMPVSVKPFATVSGGAYNRAIGNSSTIGGGSSNNASGFASTVGGGSSNESTNASSVVAGGTGNSSTNFQSTVSGGFSNYASGRRSTVVGGFENTASGEFGTAAGGKDNCAGGQSSWVGGVSAASRPGAASGDAGEGCFGVPIAAAATGDAGTFVWADSQELPFVSSGVNQFLVRANGGVGLNITPYDANIEMTLRGRIGGSTAAGNLDLALLPTTGTNNEGILFSAINGGAGSNDVSLRIAHSNTTQVNERLRLDASGSVTIRSNITGAETGVTMAAGAGAWSALSDRSLKTAVVPVDPLEVLDQLSTLPLARWQYLAQPQSVRHIGPMAQDFYAAFGVGENNTTISTIDADGVALAAIQGLNHKLQARDLEIVALRARLDALEARLTAGPR